MGSEDSIWMDQLQDKKRKKRFNEEQIRSLQSMFESQTKLDPRKKQQLAAELGLQPRQVGIWFQNKRARWKSKQLESQYGALKADYDALLCSFESLKKEKQILAKELQMLTELLHEPLERREYGDSKNEGKEDHRPSLQVPENLHSHDNGKAFSNFSELEEELFMGQTASDFSTSAEQQFCFQPSWPSNQSLKASVLPLILWFLAIQLLSKSLVNVSGLFPSSIKLHRTKSTKKEGLKIAEREREADSLDDLHRNLEVAALRQPLHRGELHDDRVAASDAKKP